MTPKRQRMILKVKEMTQEARMTPRMVNMTPKMTPKMTPRTELLQMIYKMLTMKRSLLVILRMTPKMTPIIDE